MSRDEFYRAVLIFLDQFISRGAASDVHDLRSRLESDPEARQSLESHLTSSDPPEREAFDAMTAVDSYQTAIPQPSALARIQRVAGSQLDAELVERFVTMLSGNQQALRA